MAENAVQTSLPPLAASSPLAAPPPPVPARQPKPRDLKWAAWKVLSVLASLRLTVFLLALSLVIVFTGTLAQVDLSTQTVVKTYFRGFHVWIPLQIFFPQSYHIRGGFPFPGGWLVGSFLLVNLLAAHLVRFKLSWKRTGILLIHSGLIIMMLGELMTGLFATEGYMQIQTDQTVNYVQYPNASELAIVTQSKPGTDDVVAIPAPRLVPGSTVTSPELPFDVKVVRYYANAVIQEGEPQPELKDLDLRDVATSRIAEEKPEPTGTSTDQKFNQPATYVTFLAKDTHESLGTYLLGFAIPPQPIVVAGKTYQLELRYGRVYKPYQFTLLEGRHDKYQGTEIPRNFSSKVQIVDKATGEDRTALIRMNEPLRYRGEAFYQASMDGSGNTAITGLQVVNNPGWLMPYFSCAIVSLGLLLHFGMNLNTFLQRRSGP